MAIGQRLLNIARAQLNGLVSKLEDPEKLAALQISDFEDALNNFSAEVEKQIAHLKELMNEEKRAKSLGKEAEKRAKALVEAGNDVAARKALAKQIELEQSAGHLAKMVKNQQALVDGLKKELAGHGDRVGKAIRDLVALRQTNDAAKARHQAAKSAQTVQKMQDWGNALEKFRSQVDKQVALADAAMEMVLEKELVIDVEKETLALEIEERLQKMKKELGLEPAMVPV